MAFNVSLYNDSVIKSVLPNANIRVYSSFHYIPGKEYILKGIFIGKFYVSNVYEVKKMTFKIKNIVFRDSKSEYSVLGSEIISYQDGNEIPPEENVLVSGCFYNSYKDAVYSCEGYWDNGKDGKAIFRITAYSQVKSSSYSILEAYLENVLKGLSVGPVTIKKILDKFDTHSLEKIKNDDPELSKIIKSDKKRNAIIERITTLEEREKALTFLTQWKLSVTSAIAVIDKLGASAYSIIYKNPNRLFEFPFVSAKLIDEMSINQKLKYNDSLRISGFIRRYFSSKASTNGDIYVDSDDFWPLGTDETFENSPFSQYVSKNGIYKEKLTNITIKTVLDTLKIDSTKTTGSQCNFYVVEEDNLMNPSSKCLYYSYYSYVENKIIEKLKYLISKKCPTYIDTSYIDKYISGIETSGFEMDIKQKDAVKMALQSSISILSGGPGTGKTQTTKTIVDIFVTKNPNAKIQLCAPTGKASRRMSEVINLPATTIHKSLNYVPFSQVDLVDIDADLLIIDETSMMDIDLFFKVLTHIKENTSILLVGDYNQLPSVGPGLILRDLIDSKKIPTTILTTVFRQSKGSHIVDMAYNVLNNTPDKIPRDYKKPVSRDFIFCNRDTDEETYESLKKYIKKMLKRGIPAENIQIITPVNTGQLGVLGLNLLARNILNPTGILLGEIYISPVKTFWTGDRVIQCKNDYDLDVFNGSIGTIISIDPNKNTAVIEFDGVRKDYKHKDLLNLKLGYAITVHKSQGSEFSHVIMPMSIQHSFVSNKNLLYTAITRAKKKFILVGQETALVKTCEAVQHFSRKSQIKNKLIFP